MTRMPAGAPIVTAAQMRSAEEAVFASGVAQDALMERAGAAAAQEAWRFALGRPVLVLAGPGNNGGDAFVVARHLWERGLDVQVAALGEAKPGAAAGMRARWQGVTVPLPEAQPRPVLIDGLFGTGMARALDPAVAEPLHRLVAHAAFSLAIDLPSGIATDSGADLGAARMTATVALGALKPAHVLASGLEHSGHVLLADIGVPVETRWRSVARPRLTSPGMLAHKYTRGLVVIAEGAMPGAARLAASAAIHGGAGYGILAGPEPHAAGPDALVRRRIVSAAQWRDLLADTRIAAVAIGPGLGRGDDARAWLEAALASNRPLVIDGDALALLDAARLKGRAAPVWLTPHSGEFDRLFGNSDASKIARTLQAAAATGATVIHKGADTVIAAPDGAVRVLAGASPWLSTAGTGDVLAGLVAARVAAGDGDAAAETAVWLHTRAARLAAPAFIADGLLPRIPEAIDECL